MVRRMEQNSSETRMVLWNKKCSFEASKFEVEWLEKAYGRRVVIQAMKHSLLSPATHVVGCLGTKQTYNEIMEAWEI